MLKNLKLRPEALKGLNLPITVRGGVLGTLRLKVCACQPGFVALTSSAVAQCLWVTLSDRAVMHIALCALHSVAYMTNAS